MKKLSNNLLSESVLKIGSVYEVRGNKIIIKVDKEKNAPHLLFDGGIIKNVSVGSYVKITKGFNEIIGKIEGEYISDDKSISQSEYKSFKDKIKRFLNVTLVGFIENNGFKQGLKELPLIENDCYLLTQVEFELIHSFAKKGDDLITIGNLLNETSVNIKLGVDKLFASHIGIFGNTGSGKSYTLAKIYHELFKLYKENKKFQENAKFVIIDFNGEYVNPKIEKGQFDKIIIEEKYKEEYILPTRKFPISKESIENVEILSILLDATEKTQKPFLDRVLNNKKINIDEFKPSSFIKNELLEIIWKKESNELNKEFLLDLFENLYPTLESNSISYHYQIKDLLIEKLDFNSTSKGFYVPKSQTTNGDVYYGTNPLKFNDYFKTPLYELIDKLEFKTDLGIVHIKIILNYFYEYVNGFKNIEFISFLLKRAKRSFYHFEKYISIDINEITKVNIEKFITIVSLKNISDNSIKKSLALLISKSHYDDHKKLDDKKKYLNIIVDEAHNILSKSSTRESETWKDYRLETFEEIIKEGRKFGVFLTIASQRPSDISDTIISQLHNYFLHRLINNKDIEAIGRTVSYLDKVSFDSLSILPQGACILAGLSADLPVVIKVDEITEGYRPYNETIELTKHWK